MGRYHDSKGVLGGKFQPDRRPGISLFAPPLGQVMDVRHVAEVHLRPVDDGYVLEGRLLHRIRVSVGVGLDTALVYIRSSSKHVEDAVQLAYGYLTDGKVEQQAFDEWKRKKRAQLRTAAFSAQGQLSMAMGRQFYGNDPRLIDLNPSQVGRLTPEQGEQWLKRIVDSGAVEVSFVGDITLERALELACRYVGCLSQRPLGAWQALDSLRQIKRGARHCYWF